MNVSGQRQKRVAGRPRIYLDGKWRDAIQSGQDKEWLYQAACVELAEDLGWKSEDVCYYWSQIAICRERFNREPQALAEFMALRNVREALDCRGRDAS